MLGLRGYMPPAGQENFASITPFGGGNAGSFKYKRSAVVQRVLRPAGRPGSLSYNQVFLSTRLEQGLLICQLAAWERHKTCQLLGTPTNGRGPGWA